MSDPSTIGVDAQQLKDRMATDARAAAQKRAHEAGEERRRKRDEARQAAVAGDRAIAIVRGINGIEAIHRGDTLTIGLKGGQPAAAAAAQEIILTVFYNGALADIAVSGHLV